MINPFYISDRSKAHDRCAGRVKSHLKTICTSAEKEQGLVSGTRIDAWGYDSKKKILYLCEIKVQHKDFPKSIDQITNAERRVKLSPEFTRLGKARIVPVVAISNSLYNEETGYYPEKWASFCNTCSRLNISIWVVEQSNIRYLQGPNPTLLKAKSTTKARSTTKAKTTTKIKSSTKAKTATRVKPPAKAKTIYKVKSTAKAKTATKAKAPVKAKTAIKAKAPAKAKTATKAKPTAKARRK